MASIWTAPNGKRYARAYAGKTESGKTRNLSVPIPENATEQEVGDLKDLVSKRADFCRGRNVDFTVRGVLLAYIEDLRGANKAESGVTSFVSYVRCYIPSYLGELDVEDAAPHQFSNLYNKLKKEGGKDKRPISANTIRQFHDFMSRAFKSYQAQGLIRANPLDGVKRPLRQSYEATPLNEYDFQQFVDHLLKKVEVSERDSRYVAYLFDLNTGARRGELSGFEIRDFQPSQKRIRVARSIVQVKHPVTGKKIWDKEPKSDTSIRWISLDDDTCQMLEIHIKAQRKRLAEKGIRQTGKTALFANSKGELWKPSYLTDRFREIKKELKLDPAIKLKSLRHTHATYLIMNGVDIKTVSERLGHYDVSVTLKIYAHVMPGRDALAAKTTGEVLNNLSTFRKVATDE